jgi:hypothetical protein
MHFTRSSSNRCALIQFASDLTTGVCCWVDGSDLGARVESRLQVVVLGQISHFSVGSCTVMHSLSKVIARALSLLKSSGHLPTRLRLTSYLRLL